ncbi:uncharacterized protein LOC130993364 isoform X2 [Salvia miltiorrhiza]|uniref:uncharacterized protein LOC130993364 isoform X2 n=1 Tax=Salvia miltiorrhiza TaxID=226208 RepID=UPI0025AD91BC|nr:uncharacterized protein LOC130993364 isoform X2 [Salvia miltiorrhiza]
MSRPNSDSSGKSTESVGSYCFIHGHKPCSNSSTPDLMPDAKWWLNHYGLEKGYSLDQLNVFNTDAKLFAANYLKENSKTDGESKPIEGYCSTDYKNDPVFCSEHLKHLFSHCKSNGDSWPLGFEYAIDNNDLLPNAYLTGLESCNCTLFQQPEKLCSDLDSHWIGVKKIEPWWHTVDKDDLASLTSQNTYCDHPGVQSMHYEKVSENFGFCFDQHETKMMDEKTKLSHVAECTQCNFASASISKPLGKQGLADPTLLESDRSCSKVGHDAEKVEPSDPQVPNGGLSRGELLEALCHSQTRAREAEKLAQEACVEKDHVFDLFFQQASCLFAYRQWLRLLQLETLCLHLRSKDEITSFAPPSLSSWVRSKGVTSKKNRCGAAKKKVNRRRCNISKCAVAFAIGLGLAGAGLLAGWTIGWLFPAF